MSPNNKDKKMSLEQLTKEAASARAPSVDWAKMEASIFDRIDSKELPSEDSAVAEVVQFPHPFPPGLRTQRGRTIGMMVASMAVAAGVAFFSLRTSETIVPNSSTVAATRPLAGSFTKAALASTVSINGSLAPVGQSIYAEDDIVVSERAEFERAGAVSWFVERDRGANSLGTSAPAAHVKVARADSSLVLALSEGAIEAEVVPVHAPESFAVEIGYEGHLSRVSVHGTHLRVVRRASRVIVDLTHGVVSIDVPELGANGSGEHISAPSHIEYDARDPRGTTVVTHPEAMRIEQTPPSIASAAPNSPAPSPAVVAAAPQKTAAVETTQEEPRGSSPSPAPEVKAPVVNAPAAAPAPQPNLSPEQAIAQAIQTCSKSVPSSAGQVKLTISSSLELHVAPNGTVSLAKFDPPLPPDVQSCAARAIYKTRFSKGGIFNLPVEVNR